MTVCFLRGRLGLFVTNGVRCGIDQSGSSKIYVLIFRLPNTKILKTVIVKDPDPDFSFKLTVKVNRDSCKNPCLFFGCIILLFCFLNYYFKCIVEEVFGLVIWDLKKTFIVVCAFSISETILITVQLAMRFVANLKVNVIACMNMQIVFCFTHYQ